MMINMPSESDENIEPILAEAYVFLSNRRNRKMQMDLSLIIIYFVVLSTQGVHNSVCVHCVFKNGENTC